VPDLPPYLSISQVTTYLQCPRKYRFRYVDHVEPEHRPLELALGSAVHATIGWWIEEKAKGRVPGDTDVDRIFRTDWFAESLGVPLKLGDHDLGEVTSLGRSLVRAFTTRFLEEPLGERPKVEERFEVAIYDRLRGRLPMPLVGYYDIADETGITEVKTSARKASWRNWFLQVAAYSYARAQTTGRKPKVRLVTLVKTKTPAIEVASFTVPNEDEAWMIEVVGETYASMRTSAFHPVPSYMCQRCEYLARCRHAA
jgi:CRISPR/Cas system-associated exonuclease Cas4 (RecB family)